jgi:hypothetical protein
VRSLELIPSITKKAKETAGKTMQKKAKFK